MLAAKKLAHPRTTVVAAVLQPSATRGSIANRQPSKSACSYRVLPSPPVPYRTACHALFVISIIHHRTSTASTDLIFLIYIRGLVCVNTNGTGGLNLYNAEVYYVTCNATDATMTNTEHYYRYSIYFTYLIKVEKVH